jgi:uncharacterized protein (DUF1697 family)
MMQYLILFRGINVGGKHIVKMDSLKNMLESLNLKEIKTYLQSGNAIVESDKSEQDLISLISEGFVEKFGFKSEIKIRSFDEMNFIINNLPFSETEVENAILKDPKVTHLYVYFLNEAPLLKTIETLNEKDISEDKVEMGEREIYLLCIDSIRKSKLAIQISKNYVNATARNWKTVNKLVKMMS